MIAILSFKEYIAEKAGGQAAGKIEVAKTPLEKAVAYAQKVFDGKLYENIPDFDENYLHVQKLARMGYAKRKDMPVITPQDVHELQIRLKSGMIDVRKPFGKLTDPKDPFPEGLSGEDAKKWLEAGVRVYDGKTKDDIVKVYTKKFKVGELKPIQEQIYLDKVLPPIAQNGPEASKKFFASTTFIVSSDGRIIDGHHRWLGANLLDPELMVTGFVIDMPIKKLLPLTLAYSDAIGNKRNQ